MKRTYTLYTPHPTPYTPHPKPRGGSRVALDGEANQRVLHSAGDFGSAQLGPLKTAEVQELGALVEPDQRDERLHVGVSLETEPLDPKPYILHPKPDQRDERLHAGVSPKP